MKTISCFIIEDEPLQLKWLIDKIQTIEGLHFVGSGSNFKECLDGIQSSNPELVFADIQLEDCTVFDILEQLDTRLFKTIFLSTHDDFGIPAIKKGAFDYMIKPITEQELLSSIARFRSNRQYTIENSLSASLPSKTPLKKIAVANRDCTDLIEIDQIIYLKADSSYTHFYLKNNKRLMTSKSLKEFDIMLQETNKFYRIHQSFLINTSEIKKIIRTNLMQVVMSNDHTLNVARSKKTSFLDHILL